MSCEQHGKIAVDESPAIVFFVIYILKDKEGKNINWTSHFQMRKQTDHHACVMHLYTC